MVIDSLEENLQTEKIKKLAGRTLMNTFGYLSSNAVMGSGLVGGIYYGSNVITKYLNSSSFTDFRDLGLSGVCLNIAALGFWASYIFKKRLKEDNRMLREEIRAIHTSRE